MKTQQEIAAHIKTVKPAEDFFGAEVQDLCLALDFEHVKEFLTPEGLADPTTPDAFPVYREDADVLRIMHNYLEFAYGKAYGRRGLSANRSISHFLAWSFLVDDGLYTAIRREYDTNYRDYGLHILRLVDHYLQGKDFDPVDPVPTAVGIEED